MKSEKKEVKISKICHIKGKLKPFFGSFFRLEKKNVNKEVSTETSIPLFEHVA